MKPLPVIRERTINPDILADLNRQNVPGWLANILARKLNKPIGYDLLMNPVISGVADPSGIPDMAKAVERTVRAITNGESIDFAVDHDMDGTASAAILWTAFVDYFGVMPDRIRVVTSHRLTEGYGVSDPVADRIIAGPATLIITADKGSSDEPRIKRIVDAGKDLIVTDHHLVPEDGPPMSALAVVNPARADSQYDPFMCGAGVAFLFMCKVRTALIESGFKKDIPTLTSLLDFVAVGTVADCVALVPDISPSNRAFIRFGLHLINQDNSRPCFDVFRSECGGYVKSEDISWKLAPAIASAGRLDWAEVGFKFLIAKTVAEAKEHWQILQSENLKRRALEKSITAKAIEAASKMNERQSIIVYMEDGHSGVHGISASRVVEAYGKPCGIFAPKGAGARKGSPFIPVEQEGYASGSFRGVAGVHLKNALEQIRIERPGLIKASGGHAAAAGAQVLIERMDEFSDAFEAAIRAQIGDEPLKPVIWVDGTLDKIQFNLDTVNQLNTLEPWGKDFSYPSFQGEFKIIDCTTMGNGSHLRLSLHYNGMLCKGVWFNAIEPGEPLPVSIGGTETLVYQLKVNEYKGNKSLQLQIITKIAD